MYLVMDGALMSKDNMTHEMYKALKALVQLEEKQNDTGSYAKEFLEAKDILAAFEKQHMKKYHMQYVVMDDQGSMTENCVKVFEAVSQADAVEQLIDETEKQGLTVWVAECRPEDDELPSLIQRKNGEYIMQPALDGSFCVDIANLSVHLQRDENGIHIQVHPSDREDMEPIAEMSVTFDEGF